MHLGELLEDLGPGGLYVPQGEGAGDLVHHQGRDEGHLARLGTLKGKLLITMLDYDLAAPGYAESGWPRSHCT